LCDDITDGDQHCVTFRRGDPAWIFHSEPIRHEQSYTGEQLGTLYKESFQRWHRVDIGFARQLFEKTRDIARSVIIEEEPERADLQRPLLDDPIIGADQRSLLLRTADILAATLGVTLVLVGLRK
jgi:hypothetical protein